jgi:hypothetical protein
MIYGDASDQFLEAAAAFCCKFDLSGAAKNCDNSTASEVFSVLAAITAWRRFFGAASSVQQAAVKG